MAEASVSLSQDQFSCSICLDLLKDLVTIPCGHSYCMSCITGCWDQDDQKGVYSCPQCRQTFTPRPVLGKNTMLAEVVEKLKKTKLHAAHPAHCYAGPGDVECDVCTGRKYKAVKSCLVCLESYCQTHFERHEGFHSGKHKMTNTTGGLQKMICPQHDKLLELYCRNEEKCICMLCMVDEHKNHDIVSAAAERTEKQRQLADTLRTFQQRIQERERKLQELREAVESHKRSAQAAVEDSERIFTELIRSIERSRSEVTQLIRDQEKAAVSRTKGLLKRLEQEIADLRRRDTELEQLLHTEDHIHFLQSFQSLSDISGSTNSPNITVSSLLTFDDVGKSLSHLRKKLEDFCNEEMKKISGRVTGFQIILNTRSRNGFLQYFQRFTLDPNTASKYLILSNGNREFTVTNTPQPYHDHPERFDPYNEVLCKESVCGRCYWEVQVCGNGWVSIAVSYKSISRKGDCAASRVGANDASWTLLCFSNKSYFWHNNKPTELPVVPRPSRIGVYVDHSAGTLSFYRVSDTMTLIHRVQTTFTQPLYPMFWVHVQDVRVRLLDP